MNSHRLRRRLERQSFLKSIKFWISYVEKEKPWGINYFSWNGRGSINLQKAKMILEKRLYE